MEPAAVSFTEGFPVGVLRIARATREAFRDFLPIVFAERGGQLVFCARAPLMDRDMGLRAARMICSGMRGVEAVTVVFDTYCRVQSCAEPGPEEGELEARFLRGEAGVTEALFVARASADRPVRAIYLPYLSGPPFRWKESEELKGVLKGVVAEELARVFSQRGIVERLDTIELMERIGMGKADVEVIAESMLGVILKALGFEVCWFLEDSGVDASGTPA